MSITLTVTVNDRGNTPQETASMQDLEDYLTIQVVPQLELGYTSGYDAFAYWNTNGAVPQHHVREVNDYQDERRSIPSLEDHLGEESDGINYANINCLYHEVLDQLKATHEEDACQQSLAKQARLICLKAVEEAIAGATQDGPLQPLAPLP